MPRRPGACTIAGHISCENRGKRSWALRPFSAFCDLSASCRSPRPCLASGAAVLWRGPEAAGGGRCHDRGLFLLVAWAFSLRRSVMRCSQCGHDNPEQVKFCGECGTRIEGLCPGCGTSNPPTNKFCHQCGQALAPLPTPTARFTFPQSYTPPHLA